jgi:hypothetical protein
MKCPDCRVLPRLPSFKSGQTSQFVLGYDHVVLLLALIILDYNLTPTSWHSSSGLRGRKRTYRTIFEWADLAFLNGKICPPTTSEAGARWASLGR